MKQMQDTYAQTTLVLILCKNQAIRERRILLADQILQKRHLVRHLSSTTEFKTNLPDFVICCHEGENKKNTNETRIE